MSTPINPYVSPAPEGPVLAVSVGPPPRPVWVTLACVIAVVFGAIGLLNSLSGLMMLVVGNFTSGPPAGLETNPQIKAQYEVQQVIEKASEPYRWFMITQLVVNIFLGAALLYGGVTTLSNSKTGRVALIWTFRIGAVYILIWGAIFLYQQLQMLPVVQTQMEKVAATMKGAPPNTADIMRMLVTITFYSVLVIMLTIALLQLIAYTLSANYLASDEITALLDAQTEAAEAQSPIAAHVVSPTDTTSQPPMVVTVTSTVTTQVINPPGSPPSV